MKRQGTSVGVAVCLAKWMVLLLGGWLLVSTSMAANYYIPPSVEAKGLDLASLRDGNRVHVGDRQFTLDSGELRQIPATELIGAGRLTAERALTLTGVGSGTDMPPTEHYLGTEYVVPQSRGRHQYSVYSPYQATTLNVKQGDATSSHTLQTGVWFTITSEDNTQPLQLRSAVPVVVYHHSLQGKSTVQDAFAVPPAANDLIGMAGATTLVAALQNDTHLTVIGSEGETVQYTLQSGEQIHLGTTTREWGQAYRLKADKPIMAVSFSQGQNADAQAFWPQHLLAADYRLPRKAQRLLIACPEPATQLRWLDENGQEYKRACGLDKGRPGQHVLTGDFLSPGFRLRGDHPIMVWAEIRSAAAPIMCQVIWKDSSW